jgi:hypothetical protein
MWYREELAREDMRKIEWKKIVRPKCNKSELLSCHGFSSKITLRARNKLSEKLGNECAKRQNEDGWGADHCWKTIEKTWRQ